MPNSLLDGKIAGFDKKFVVIGGAVLVIVIGVVYYRSKQQSASSVDAAGSTSIDPATGYAYGSAEDAAALASQSNYVNPAQYGYGYGGNYVPSGTTAATGFTNNAAWAQAAEAYMVDIGGDANLIGNALGKYIAGAAVTSDQQSLIQQAIAFEGIPPVGGTNGYPPSIRTATTAPTEPPADTTPTNVAPPQVKNLRAVHKQPWMITLIWDPSPGATSYTVNYGIAPNWSMWHTTTSSSSAPIGNLKPSTKYSFSVVSYKGVAHGWGCPAITASTTAK